MVNFRRVTYVSSTGFAALFKLLSRARAEGREVKLCGIGNGVRLGAYLKTKDLADPAYAWLRSDSETGTRFVSTRDRGPKGTSDWGPQEVVLDMAVDAGGLSFGVVAPGAGTLGVDDASLEVVDPAEVHATEGVTVRPLDPAKRARELKESLPSTPNQPENLECER